MVCSSKDFSGKIHHGLVRGKTYFRQQISSDEFNRLLPFRGCHEIDPVVVVVTVVVVVVEVADKRTMFIEEFNNRYDSCK